MPHKYQMTAKQKFYNWVATLVVALVALAPTWFWIIARWLMEPEGFWQNFILFGVGLWLMGFVQLVLIVVAFMLIVAIWK